MTILYCSDFDLNGSGYSNIGQQLCLELANRGYDITALGISYKREQHNYPFTIVPVDDLRNIVPMIGQLLQHGMDIEAVVVALDIPLQERLLQQLQAPGNIPYIGLFPLEAGPLCGPWALSLLRMSERLVMSEFGKQELADKGVESDFIPIGADTDLWRPPYPEERATIRQKLGAADDTFVVLTVADNQERKNLSRSLEIFADFARDTNAVYWLVTRPDSPVGWKLEDYAMDLGIMDKVQIYRRGMPAKNLWAMFAAADSFLLTSKAEGLAMPVLEAMACRLPVVGTKCAAIEEHLSGGRGLLIDADYVYVDPFGNGRRYLASREDGAYKLQLLRHGFSPADYQVMLDDAQDYVRDRTWEKVADVLEAALKRTVRTHRHQPIQETEQSLLELAP